MNEFMKRVVMPTLVPVVSLAMIIVVVFNLSRILIGLHDNNGPRWVVVFATVLGIIMFGGFIYYSSTHARKEGNSAVLASFGIAFVFLGFLGAELIQAHEQHEEEGADIGPAAVTIVAVDNDFPEKSFSIAQGAVIGYENQGNALHTLVAEGAPAFEKLTVPTNGAEAKEVVNLDPGDYTFFCDIPGHRASGMEATVTVTAGGGGGGGTAAGEEGGEAGAGGGEADAGGEAAAGGEGGGGGGVEIASTEDITFEPTDLTAPAGAKITLRNRGGLPHDFTLEGAPSFAPLVVFSDGDEAMGMLNVDPGEYVFFCSVPGHRQIGMEGVLTVTGGG